MHVTDQFNPDLNIGTELIGYKVLRKEALTEINAVYYELEHFKTGARHIHISMDDAENTFAVAFKTVPKDSSGVAHILEHTALCGSKLYPVRDPFFSMIKRSLNTFMNAFTASDWTMYPFATQNRQDYYNLLSIYLDAAFFPRLDELSFKQEGHRVEFNEKGELEFKGVVYNEMKGAMSSADEVLGRSMMKALYPSSTYSNNSGGDPRDIPKLTYAGLLKFHKMHYHPSNALFFTYGNFPLKDHLKAINAHVLECFEKSAADLKIEVQPEPRWLEPRQFKYYYALDKDEITSEKSQVVMAWLTADITSSKDMLIMEILNQILLGNAAAPLRKALMDTKLGSALSDYSGFEDENRETFFSCGLKDTDVKNLPRIKHVIMDTLAKLADEGIPWELVETAIHQIEFHRREISNTGYPFGLRLCLWFAGCVLNGGDAVKAVQAKDEIEAIAKEAKEERLLERSLRRFFIDNPHCAVITLEPDSEINAEFEQYEKGVLQTMLANLTDDERRQIETDAKALETLQDTEEDLSVLPALTKADIPLQVPTVDKNDFDAVSNTSFYYQNTSEISYISAVAGLQQVEPKLYPLLPFFALCFTKMGTKTKTYEELALALDRYTGDTSVSVGIYHNMRDDSVLPLFVLNTKALPRNQANMLALLDELLNEQTFGDLTRLEMLLKEYSSALEAGIVRNGHSLAVALASRGLTQLRALSEMLSGIHQYQYIKNLCQNLDKTKLEIIAANLNKIYKSILADANFKFACINHAEACAQAKEPLRTLYAKLPPGPAGFGPLQNLPLVAAVNEGWMTTSAVSFDAASQKCVTYGHPDAPVLSVIAKLLKSIYLHREIREKGGAYGGIASFGSDSGVFSLASYRDPHVVSTLNTFDKARKYIAPGVFDDEDVTEAILQVASDLGKPHTPSMAARLAFMREITGLTDDDRQAFKLGVLEADADKIIAVAQRYFGNENPVSRAVISNREKLIRANVCLGANALELHNI